MPDLTAIASEGEDDEASEGFYSALLEDDAEALYERAPCGYLSTTPEGTIVKVNGTFLAWTGYESADLVGRRTFADLLTVGGRIYHETHYAPMLRMQGTAREIALEIVCADDRRIPVLVNSVLESDSAGNPVVVRSAVFDATERREYERELLRAKERAEVSESHARLLARTLQQTLIPPAPPEIPGLEVGAAYRPAGAGDEVGGDFYDVFQVGPGDWVAAIGDVQGKGVEAAVVTALVRYTIRAAVVQLQAVDEALEVVNGVLLRHDTDRFCTVALMRLRQTETGWKAGLCSAGHPLPLLRRSDGEPVPVGPYGTLLGLFDQVHLEESTVELEPGDAVLLFTDGVTEAKSGSDLLGQEGVIAMMEGCAPTATAADLAESLLGEVLGFQGGDPRDDIAVVALRVPADQG